MSLGLFASTVVPDDQGRYLTMFHHKKQEHPWRFPGGKIDPGEEPIEAALRELREEAGVSAQSIRLGHITKPHVVDGGSWQGWFYIVQPDGPPRIMEPEKVSKLEYLTPEELLARDSVVEYAVVKEIEKWAIYKQLYQRQ